MYTLYYSPGTAALVVHQMLIETGASYQIKALNLGAREHKESWYLKLNPSGVVPTLMIGENAYSEAAGLTQLLAERHPETKLAPAIGSVERGHYLQWFGFLNIGLQAHFRPWFYPAEFGPAEVADAIKAASYQRVKQAFDLIEAHLQISGPFLLGESISAADLYLTMLLRWSRNMPSQGIDRPALKHLAEQVKARPSWARTYQEEGLTEW